MKSFNIFITECAMQPLEMNLRDFLIRYSLTYNSSMDMKTLNTYIVMMSRITSPCVRGGAIDTMGFSFKNVLELVNKGLYKENIDWIKDYDGSIIMTPKMAFSMMRRMPLRYNRFHRNVKFLNAGIILYAEYKQTRANIDSLIA